MVSLSLFASVSIAGKKVFNSREKGAMVAAPTCIIVRLKMMNVMRRRRMRICNIDGGSHDDTLSEAASPRLTF